MENNNNKETVLVYFTETEIKYELNLGKLNDTPLWRDDVTNGLNLKNISDFMWSGPWCLFLCGLHAWEKEHFPNSFVRVVKVNDSHNGGVI